MSTDSKKNQEPIATLSIAEEANCDQISFLIDDCIERGGLLEAESNEDGTYDIYEVE